MNALPAIVVLALAVVAAIRPALGPGPAAPAGAVAVEWPATFEGATLHRAALLPAESRFAAGFPGATAAFDDGRNRIVMRRVTQPTRRLHPIETCLRAGGFSVRPVAALRHPQSGRWGVVRATKDGRVVVGREQIRSADGAHAWTDVSAWYWDALFHPQRGPWLAITVISPADTGR